MVAAAPGIVTSFPVTFYGNALNVSVCSAAAATPAEACVIRFEHKAEVQDAPDGLKFASIVHAALGHSLQIAGHYQFYAFLPNVMTELFSATSNVLRLANFHESCQVVVHYDEAVPGTPLRNIASMFAGISWYLCTPSTEAFPDIKNGIRDVFLVLSEGASRVWQERFAPLISNEGDFWLFVDFFHQLECMDVETLFRADAEKTEAAVGIMRETNFALQGLLVRIEGFIAHKYPDMAPDARKALAEATYAHCMKLDGMRASIESKEWHGYIQREMIRFMERRLNEQREAAAFVDMSDEAFAILRDLERLAIPEFSALDPSRQKDAAVRIANEREEEALAHEE